MTELNEQQASNGVDTSVAPPATARARRTARPATPAARRRGAKTHAVARTGTAATVEGQRLATSAAGAAWQQWGPYLSERQWGTVREDYSPHGNAWEYFPHDHARSRVYRWGEDGIAGFSDAEQRLCVGVALWNGRDSDPEGAAVRPDERRGQSRRGREGALLLPRRHAEPFVPEDAL